MTRYSETIEINAPPSEVFNLIRRVEEFSRYSTLITSVVKTGEMGYRWKARFSGIRLEWDAVVTENYPPWRFAWQSVKGFQNAGSYTLTPSEKGSRVCFEMEYNFKSSLVEKTLSSLSDRYVKKLSQEILAEIKKRLEGNENPTYPL